jgi:hypothetical protein
MFLFAIYLLLPWEDRMALGAKIRFFFIINLIVRNQARRIFTIWFLFRGFGSDTWLIRFPVVSRRVPAQPTGTQQEAGK